MIVEGSGEMGFNPRGQELQKQGPETPDRATDHPKPLVYADRAVLSRKGDGIFSAINNCVRAGEAAKET